MGVRGDASLTGVLGEGSARGDISPLRGDPIILGDGRARGEPIPLLGEAIPLMGDG